MNENCLYLVTGPRGCGKSLFCHTVAVLAKEDGWKVSGIISHPVTRDGIKVAIDAENLQSGEVKQFASLTRESDTDTLLGKWYLNRAVVDWGNRMLEASLPCDLFVVDELGPLEFLRGDGWTKAIEQIRRRKYRIALLVIRPELLEMAHAMLPVAGIIPLAAVMDIQAEAHGWWQKITGAGNE